VISESSIHVRQSLHSAAADWHSEFHEIHDSGHFIVKECQMNMLMGFPMMGQLLSSVALSVNQMTAAHPINMSEIIQVLWK
jgi:hypothetical protein